MKRQIHFLHAFDTGDLAEHCKRAEGRKTNFVFQCRTRRWFMITDVIWRESVKISKKCSPYRKSFVEMLIKIHSVWEDCCGGVNTAKYWILVLNVNLQPVHSVTYFAGTKKTFLSTWIWKDSRPKYYWTSSDWMGSINSTCTEEGWKILLLRRPLRVQRGTQDRRLFHISYGKIFRFLGIIKNFLQTWCKLRLLRSRRNTRSRVR